MRAPSEDFRVQAAPKDETALFASARRFISPPRYGIADQRTILDADARSGYCRTSRPLDPASSRTKRSFDIVASILALALFLPGLLAIAAAIKLTSRGSVLFVQRRYGLNNKNFMIYKFRTMYVDKGDETGVEQTREADQRVTPIGKLLRRHNLDELPQLLNIVKGDMSLVGPRPHVPGNLAGGLPYEVLVTNYFERHRVRPGLSGLAQANGFRGSTTDANLAKARIDLDLHYIQNWSFGLDLRIILRTIRSQFLKSGKGI